ncbi:hypothetical protein LOTGIDRAFT_157549 [Lottia gigantea]|uniref:G-protein coupled receptors family 1 profile domain-containing protein n=1 Tax=Lottia gigantea TaxID=225164 RepID=V4B5P6_LOTGI|nr:hypothetical protein LOTGIDRAFT_157549 [Lottia gigantea]ESP01372.1 hypothetical protein LOTGIDRAFT_157549 [Lottia gigantea]
MNNTTCIDNCTIGIISGNTTKLSGSITTHSIIIVCIEMLIMFIICAGNTLTFTAIWKTPRLQTVPNQYIMSLACADLLVGLILPYQVALHFPGVQEIFDKNKYLCLGRHCAFYVSLGQTIQTITAIAIDRAVCIGSPLKYKTTASMKRTRILIFITWITAILFGTIPLHSNNYKVETGCYLFKTVPFYFHVYLQPIVFVAFCSVNVICYSYIFYISRQHIKNRNKQLAIVDAKLHNNNMKLVKMFLTVFGVFFICMTPGFTSVILGQIVGLPNGIVDICLLPALLNSGMNFFIYAVANMTFRQAFAGMICCGSRRTQNSCYRSSNLKSISTVKKKVEPQVSVKPEEDPIESENVKDVILT